MFLVRMVSRLQIVLKSCFCFLRFLLVFQGFGLRLCHFFGFFQCFWLRVWQVVLSREHLDKSDFRGCATDLRRSVLHPTAISPLANLVKEGKTGKGTPALFVSRAPLESAKLRSQGRKLYIYTCVHIYWNTYIYTHIHTYTYTYEHIPIWPSIHPCMHAPLFDRPA